MGIRACLERGLTLSAKEMRCHSRVRWDRRLESLRSASVSLSGAIVQTSLIVVVEGYVTVMTAFPFLPLFLSSQRRQGQS